ncbi:hypothetical protein SDC9_152935 [bioreactor metagenome]|uniref:Uncharacterized protein n=1 Tax=bioreactor metagenome TaxID=1076179 RepID=A0A645EZ64_9ZZZZ
MVVVTGDVAGSLQFLCGLSDGGDGAVGILGQKKKTLVAESEAVAPTEKDRPHAARAVGKRVVADQRCRKFKRMQSHCTSFLSQKLSAAFRGGCAHIVSSVKFRWVIGKCDLVESPGPSAPRLALYVTVFAAASSLPAQNSVQIAGIDVPLLPHGNSLYVAQAANDSVVGDCLIGPYRQVTDGRFAVSEQ